MIILKKISIKIIEITIRKYVFGLLKKDLIRRISIIKNYEDFIQIRREKKKLFRKLVRIMKKILEKSGENRYE
jgi:hypothetical protein